MTVNRTIILGTDWWTDCDDVAAVRITCRMAKKGIWKIAGFVLNACMEYSARSLDSFIRAEGISVPIGIDPAATDFGNNPPYQKRLALNGISHLNNIDCENGVRLYRRLLTEASDNSVELLEIGYLQVLAGLIESRPDDLCILTGIEMLQKKVRMLWVMGGCWQNNGSGTENNFSRNQRAAKGAYSVVSRYPGEICFLGHEVGEAVITHPPLDNNDLLYNAYRDHGSQHGRSSWDPMLVLLAASGMHESDSDFINSGYETVRGTAHVDLLTGKNSFTPSPDGRHIYVKKIKPDDWFSSQIDNLIGYISPI